MSTRSCLFMAPNFSLRRNYLLAWIQIIGVCIRSWPRHPIRKKGRHYSLQSEINVTLSQVEGRGEKASMGHYHVHTGMCRTWLTKPLTRSQSPQRTRSRARDIVTAPEGAATSVWFSPRRTKSDKFYARRDIFKIGWIDMNRLVSLPRVFILIIYYQIINSYHYSTCRWNYSRWLNSINLRLQPRCVPLRSGLAKQAIHISYRNTA